MFDKLIETTAVAYIDHYKLVEKLNEGVEGLDFTDFLNWAMNTYSVQLYVEGHGMLLVPADEFLDLYKEYFELDEYDATEEESEAAHQSRTILLHIKIWREDINIIKSRGIQVYIRF